jgi:hypothetical protein
LQNRLKEITAEANKAGFQVDIKAGTVAAPQHMYDAAGSGAHTVAQACSSYMWQLDTQAVTTINAILPDTQTGFGSGGSRPLALAEIEAQKGRPAKDVNTWWNGLTPEQQEQILRDYPQQVGWLDGSPPPTATRQPRLPHQHLADLQAEEDRLRALAYSTDFTPESHAARERLHDINEEQRKLAEVTNLGYSSRDEGLGPPDELSDPRTRPGSNGLPRSPSTGAVIRSQCTWGEDRNVLIQQTAPAVKVPGLGRAAGHWLLGGGVRRGGISRSRIRICRF